MHANIPYTADRSAGYSLLELLAYGDAQLSDLRKAGFSASDMEKAGFRWGGMGCEG